MHLWITTNRRVQLGKSWERDCQLEKYLRWLDLHTSYDGRKCLAFETFIPVNVQTKCWETFCSFIIFAHFDARQFEL